MFNQLSRVVHLSHPEICPNDPSHPRLPPKCAYRSLEICLDNWVHRASTPSPCRQGSEHRSSHNALKDRMKTSFVRDNLSLTSPSTVSHILLARKVGASIGSVAGAAVTMHEGKSIFKSRPGKVGVFCARLNNLSVLFRSTLGHY